MKRLIKRVPLIGPAITWFTQTPAGAQLYHKFTFPGSASYWDSRYVNGGSSGPGSYGRLAEFKAEVLNDFVKKNGIRTVIEFGCGDGAQLELSTYPEYVGIDVSTTAIELCTKKFASDATKRFFLSSAVPCDLGTFDLAMSLDVIFHLVEDSVFDTYMKSVFAHAGQYVAIYASNYDASTQDIHVRHRKFTDWIATNAPDWKASSHVPNRFPFDPNEPDQTSFADFHFFTRTTPID